MVRLDRVLDTLRRRPSSVSRQHETPADAEYAMHTARYPISTYSPFIKRHPWTDATRLEKIRLNTWFCLPEWIPLIGRVWDIPRVHAYKRFKDWSDQYGPIFSVNIFGINHVWLASDRIANDLLSRRAMKHSDRPSINQLADSKSEPEYLPLLGYNEHWRRQRKIVTQFMNTSSKAQFRNLPYLELPQMLSELIESPDDYELFMENYTGRVISRLSFGDPLHYDDIKRYSHGLLKAISPAAYVTNIIPQLKALPALLSPWKREERARHDEERVFFMRMHGTVSSKMAAGTAQPSYMKEVLDNQPKSGLSDMEAAYIVGMIGLAGVLTTSSTLMTYLLAMTLYPQWQTKVQEEIDRVCGDRMPNLDDSPQMPILRSVVMELIRWRPITPSSIPHETTEDDVYDGYFIPKGTYIHPNQWAITREASMYPDPEVFNPDRWLNPAYPTYKEPITKFPSIQNYTTFGYGRRICMGMDLVENEFFIAIGGMAWALNITKKRDAMGREIHVPQHEYSTYLISRPKKFAFELKPRSEKRKLQVADYWSAAIPLLDPPVANKIPSEE
ncbi:cytochrome P450 [Massariosphaeria phaeospora]|uniref:Cytochrome P450 n=1 Tax=Massariosphaeria phaeospora TaxID=100035 RepID=A0A7C8MET4_9PLEO|nr:cytochrome P450 [Massariosphaeria phaeospora]